MRTLFCLAFLLAGSHATADTITLKNGKQVDDSIAGIKAGSIEFYPNAGGALVENGKARPKLSLSNVKTIVFDGNQDVFVIETKGGESAERRVVGVDNGSLTLEGGASIKLATIKQMTPKAGAADQRRKDVLSLTNTQVGAEGFVSATLKVETASADEGRFIGSYTPVVEGIPRDDLKRAVIVQGVDASNLITGAFVLLPQRLKVIATEALSGGKTVFVFEPVDPEQKGWLKATDPILDAPGPSRVRVQDIRGR